MSRLAASSALAVAVICWPLTGVSRVSHAAEGQPRARTPGPSEPSTPVSRIPSVRALADKLPSSTVDFFEVAGSPAFLIRPKDKTAASPMPWMWYAPVIGHPNTSHAWMLRQWLAKGIGMAGVDVGESYGSPRGRKVFTALWDTLSTRYGTSERPR